MMILNSDDAGREIRAVVSRVRDRLECFARGYLAHAENQDDFYDQSYCFDGYEIAFSVSENGWVSVSAYPSSFEMGTDWANGFKLFSTRGA